MYRKSVLIVLIVLLLPWVVGFSPPAQADDFSLSVEAGYSGYYRAEHWTPFRVTVQSDNGAIRGYLQITVSNFDIPTTTYRTPVTIDRRTPEVTLFLYAVIPTAQRNVVIELVDQNGRTLVDERINLTELTPRDMLYGVVTESVTDTLDMTQTAIGRGDSFMTSWSIDSIPARADALNAVDVIAFFDADTAGLSVEQVEAITQWVSQGGHLLIYGGQNWQRTTVAFGDILPTVVDTTVTVPSVEAFGEYLRRSTDGLASEAVLARNTPHADATVLARVDDVPLVVRGRYGSGLVDFIAFDPLTEPFKSYANLKYLPYELTSTAEPQPSWAEGFTGWFNAERSVRIASTFAFPSVSQLMLFLGAYIALVGPVNYLILRRLKRLELAWLTIPLLIIGFTTLSYVSGFTLRGSEATIQHMNVIQVWENSETARVDTVVGISSPRRTTYTFSAAENFSLRPLPTTNNDVFLANPTERNLKVNEGSTFNISDLPVDAGIVTMFTGSGHIPTLDYDGEVVWYLPSSGEQIRLEGSFTSPIDLEDVVVISKDGALVLGDLDADARANFSLDINLQEPAWQTFGNRTSFDARFQFSGRSGRSLSYTYNYAYYAYYDCLQDPGYSTVAQLMLPHQSECVSYEGFEDLELQSRAFMLMSVINDIDFSGGKLSDVYVLGWSEDAPYSFNLADTDTDIKHTSLYVFRLDSELRPVQDVVQISPGLMTWTVAGRDAPNVRRDISPYNIAISTVEQVVMRYVPMADLQHIPINRLVLDARIAGARDTVQISLYNWDDATWDVMDLPNTGNLFSLEGADAQPYIGANNAVEVQVIALDDQNFFSVTTLEVTLFGTFPTE